MIYERGLDERERERAGQEAPLEKNAERRALEKEQRTSNNRQSLELLNAASEVSVHVYANGRRKGPAYSAPGPLT